MIKKLVRTGNSLALALPDRARISADTPLEISTDSDVIIVAPVRRSGRTARIKVIVAEAHRPAE